MLVTVLVLLLVSGIALPAVSGLSRSMRQTGLDSAAQILYLAAQKRMTELRVSGRSALYQCDPAAGIGQLTHRPADAAEDGSLLYFTSETQAERLALLLPEGYVTEEIRLASWAVEFDPASGIVHGVFYGGTEALDTVYRGSPGDDLCRGDRRSRTALGAKVGYYGGSVPKGVE